MKVKAIFTNARVIILIIALVLGIFAIAPNPWSDGVVIKGIARNSSAEAAGIEAPKPTLAPMGKERIIRIANKDVHSVSDYYLALEGLSPNQTIQVKTNKNLYRLRTRAIIEERVTNETEIVTTERVIQVNETINGTTTLVNKTITDREEKPVVLTEVVGVQDLGFSIGEAPTSNIRKGLDLQGGTRVVLRPEKPVDQDTMDLIVDSLKERLNVYGLADVLVTHVSDRPEFLGEGSRYVLVEIAGATEEEVQELVASQGNFEAKIGNETVFSGGDDITYVCRTADCSGLDPNRGCQESGEGYHCGFLFTISLDPSAAKKQADVTRQLKVIGDQLDKPLTLHLDGAQVDELAIAANLRGRAVTDIAITGSGTGRTYETAAQDTLDNMKRLQTILVTGSLPVKLEVERIDTISATLGSQFLNNALFVGFISLIAVVTVLVARYRRFIVSVPIIVTSLSELFLILSLAALIGWNLDLAAIAGIILAIGTGVDDQIIITDEALKKGTDRAYNWKERTKRAFFIIMSAYFTVVVAMVPLLFAGAGLLKGFAITTILGVSIGVFITRPAFAAIIQKLLE